MKELVQLRITDADPIINQMPLEELYEKIEIATIVLSLSFFFIQCFVSFNLLYSKSENKK